MNVAIRFVGGPVHDEVRTVSAIVGRSVSTVEGEPATSTESAAASAEADCEGVQIYLARRPRRCRLLT